MALRLPNAEYKKRSKMFEKGFMWCVPCGEFIAIRNFSKSKGAMFGYLGMCKSCHSKKRKGNRSTQSKARNYNRQLKAYYKQLMNEGKCAKCEYDKAQSALEFHHIVPENKEHSLGNLISSNNHLDILTELEKCILLCRNCHMEIESNVWKAEFIKAKDKIGYQIKEGSIVENKEECWAEVSDKILYSQDALFEMAI